MSTPLVRVGAFTDVGRVRNMNEDAFVVTDSVFMVADGMGGHLAGEVASAMAVEAMGSLPTSLTTDDACRTAIDANLSILHLSITDSSKRGMGTTLTGLVMVTGDNDRPGLAVLNVGDSRTYRMRDGQLTQVSIDHSYVQELVAAGHITKAEARDHPQRNIVTRALGIEPGVGIDVWSLPLVVGDRFLACSDGLVDEIDDDVIELVLRGTADPQVAAEELVRLANAAGGHDNTTVVVVDVLEGLTADEATDDDLGRFTTVRADLSEFEEFDTSELTDETPAARRDPTDQRSHDDGENDRDITLIGLAPSTRGAHDDDGYDDDGYDGDNRSTHGDQDATPVNDAERSRRSVRANTQFIAYGFAAALVALIIVVIVALASGNSDDEPGDSVPTDSVPTVDTSLTGAPVDDNDPTATVAGLDDTPNPEG